jgi:hypothetical protein
MSERHTIARLTRQVLTLQAKIDAAQLVIEKNNEVYKKILHENVDLQVRNEMALLALQGQDVEIKK